MSGRAAVFLDRDGTLHRERASPVRSADEIELFDGGPQALAELARAGWVLVIVTNQSAIARGNLTFDELQGVDRALAQALARAGAPIAGIYVCPHHPTEGRPPYRRECSCRKPADGLIARAARELDLDPARSWIVGDARRDVEAGLSAGARAILVETGKGRREKLTLGPELGARVVVLPDLPAAAAAILAAQGR